jgi:hypothetical protein
MKTDRYTKIVLTIIAGALVWICLRDAMPAVHASARQEPVALAGVTRTNPLPVIIVGIERTRWTEKEGAFRTIPRALPWEAIEVVK